MVQIGKVENFLEGWVLVSMVERPCGQQAKQSNYYKPQMFTFSCIVEQGCRGTREHISCGGGGEAAEQQNTAGIFAGNHLGSPGVVNQTLMYEVWCKPI